MKYTKIFLLIFGVLLYSNFASAALQMDYIQFDPTIIAAGDEVDIIAQYTDDSFSTDDNKFGNPDYKYLVKLESDDTLTEEYVIIQDDEGNELASSVYSGATYKKLFRVKVLASAPAGNYEFKLSGQWYFKGSPLEGQEFLRFKMPVKKEGIILDVSNIITLPGEVRPGDDYVKITTNLENVGEKDAKSVRLYLDLPEGISSSYTNNNQVWAGRVNAGGSNFLELYVDVDEDLVPGLYEIKGNLEYMDLDNNAYKKTVNIPFLVKSRPNIEVTGWKGETLVGKSGKLYVRVENTGSETAEAVDVRIIKQNSQPFNIGVRSDYIGELEPGEEGVAVFDIQATSDAEIKEYDLKLLIRAKGDSDEGDDNIYTFNRRTKFSVSGKAPNWLAIIGGSLAGIILLIAIARKVRK